jgi:butyryl-CoA:acetate CoA-transferase
MIAIFPIYPLLSIVMSTENKETFMKYTSQYKSKLTSSERAVTCIKNGDWVDYGFCSTHPIALDKALAARKDTLKDVKCRGGLELWRPEILNIPVSESPFTWTSSHVTGVRDLMSSGNVYYLPIRYSELPRYFRENVKSVDVAMLQVCPMDKHGYFNFGPTCSHIMAMLERAHTIILEINEKLPRCHGGHENCIHISRVHKIVEGDNTSLAELTPAKPGQFDEAIAKLVMEEIPDNACLQLGIGGMPAAVGKKLTTSGLKDFSVNTEMYVDAFVDLAEVGKISGKFKSVDRYRQTYTFAAGSKKLYEYLDDNPEMMIAPVNYVNDVALMASIDNMITINGAVEVDLFGQVNAESVGTRHISGAGGQLDFVIGAYRSKGGKSFICMPSTYTTKDGQIKSRLVPTMSPGSIVTDSRTTPQYLVTEYGKVNIKGLNTWERAEAVISIAHPDFREELIAQADKMHIWKRSNRC